MMSSSLKKPVVMNSNVIMLEAQFISDECLRLMREYGNVMKKYSECANFSPSEYTLEPMRKQYDELCLSGEATHDPSYALYIVSSEENLMTQKYILRDVMKRMEPLLKETWVRFLDVYSMHNNLHRSFKFAFPNDARRVVLRTQTSFWNDCHTATTRLECARKTLYNLSLEIERALQSKRLIILTHEEVWTRVNAHGLTSVS